MFDNPTEDQEAVKAKIAEWWSIAGAAAGSAASFVASLVGVEDATADGIKATVESWWQTIGAGLGNVCKIFASFGTPDEMDTAQAVKDLMKWFTDDFLGQIGNTLVITGKIIFDLADDAGTVFFFPFPSAF